MQRLFIAALTAAVIIVSGLAAGGITATSAHAAALPVPSAIGTVVDKSDRAQTVAYVCRRAWRCGSWGCGWRRSCYWRPNYGWRYRYFRPYTFYRPYRYSRPYRYWRRPYRHSRRW